MGESEITVIKRRTQTGEVEEALEMTQEKFEQIVTKYSNGRRVVREATPLSQRFKEAMEAADAGEELENFSCADAEGFEKAVCLMCEWSGMILREMQKQRNFRIEITHNAEALKTDLCIYTSSKEHGTNDILQE